MQKMNSGDWGVLKLFDDHLLDGTDGPVKQTLQIVIVKIIEFYLRLQWINPYTPKLAHKLRCLSNKTVLRHPFMHNHVPTLVAPHSASPSEVELVHINPQLEHHNLLPLLVRGKVALYTVPVEAETLRPL